MPSDCLKIIESKSKVRQSRAKAVVAKVNLNSSTPAISSDVAKLKDMVRALLLDKKTSPQLQLHLLLLLRLKQLSLIMLPAVVLIRNKTVPLPAERFIKTTSKRSGTLPGNTVTNPKEDLNGITTRSGVAYQGPTILTPSKVVKQGTEVTKDQVQTPSSQSTAHVQPLVTQSETPISEPIASLVSAPMPNLKLSIPYPSRHDNERRREQVNEQIEKFYEIFKDMSFKISFTDDLILMPKFASTLKALIGNKEKLSTPMNEHCSAVILNKLPKKLGDPGKFLIPCEFPGMDECLALADLGASINLMPLSVWKELALPELTPTCMTLELADRSFFKPIGIAKDVSVKVAITYNLDQTSRYSANYDQMTTNKIDVTDEACENPTPSDDPIVSITSPTLTPFEDSDFLLFEEANAFLGLEDDPDSPKLDPSYYDPERDIQMLEAILNNPSYYDPKWDILSLEAILNSDPSPPLPNHDKSVPSFKEELKVCEAKTIKSYIDEPPEVELKDLPPHLEYAFL
nr:reverse transcriptase domain-containing protein [Tanacetum cinerariifolium]